MECVFGDESRDVEGVLVENDGVVSKVVVVATDVGVRRWGGRWWTEGWGGCCFARGKLVGGVGGFRGLGNCFYGSCTGTERWGMRGAFFGMGWERRGKVGESRKI